MSKYFVLFTALLVFHYTDTSSAQPINQGPQEMKTPSQYFQTAKPVWPKGRDTEMNVITGFYTEIQFDQNSNPVITIAASTLYRIFVNGTFLGHGPARGPHGYFRVDEWTLTNLKNGTNHIAVEVAGYNSNSYYVLDQPSFLQAEITDNGKVLASTAGTGEKIKAHILTERLQKVQRFSFQRPFMEVYKLSPEYADWRIKGISNFETECDILPAKNLIPRRIPYPDFVKKPVLWHSAKGTLEEIYLDIYWKDRSLTKISEKLKGYEEDELEIIPTIELENYRSTVKTIDKPISTPALDCKLDINQFSIFDLGTNLSGFPGITVECKEASLLYLSFDEILTNGDVNFRRLGCANIIPLYLEPGIYQFESFEPYTMRYIKASCLQGSVRINNIYLREYANPDTKIARFSASDHELNILFQAGVQTFRQNVIDIFMDCPSRERAGWLCDSYFSSKVAFDLCRNITTETNFIENFALPKTFEHLPKGMLPMCYPADHYDGVFIPNWAMWFVIQLEEYKYRNGDKQLIASLKNRVIDLLDYFTKFENKDGLLENLESWVFVEWSKANDFVQDVNYPSNMLYAATLKTASRLYNMPEYEQKAEKIINTIFQQSFKGDFFCDNAERQGKDLVTTSNFTEVCQYYAFFFGIVTPESQPELWKTLCEKFGPDRKSTNAFPDVHFANAFIGNYLRMELLSRYGKTAQLLKEVKDYFLDMALRTGTFWEHMSQKASCNHGFASYINHVLYRDVLGIYEIDPVNKNVQVKITDLDLNWCEGSIPVGKDVVYLKWWKQDGNLYYKIRVPIDYSYRVKIDSKLPVIQHP